MKIRLVRDIAGADFTLGKLFIDGEFECFICEDAERAVKIPGATAIPRGRYGVVVTHSPRFKRPLPLLLNVPNFSGIRIHPGNTPENTDGCLLPGLSRTDRAVTESRLAFAALYRKIVTAFDAREPISIEITGPEGEA